MIHEAQRLAALLSDLCGDYAKGGGPVRVSATFSNLFRRWFSTDPERVSEEDSRFLAEAARLTDELAGELASAAREDPEAARRVAAGAVDQLLFSVPAKPTNDREWYLVVAGYESGKLFPYLSPEDLARVRDEMCRRTPRRMMLPRQLELLEQAERLLDGAGREQT